MSTLLYHTGALGDFITTIPALRYWKVRHKEDKLVLIGSPSIGAFAQDIGLIDDSLDVNSSRFSSLFSNQVSPEIKKFLSLFQEAILFADAASPVIENIRRSGIAPVYHQPPFPSSRVHVIDYHLSLFVDPSTIAVQDRIPAIVPSGHSFAVSYDVFASDVSPCAIHPGSGSRKKNWPFDRFLSLARSLRERGISILWLRGPADDKFAAPPEDTVVSNQPLALCAALLSRCRAYVGNDSGMTHLAAAVGRPTIALFGPSDPQIWGPSGRSVRIIYKKMPCSPCHLSTDAETACEKKCLAAITVDEVIDKIDI